MDVSDSKHSRGSTVLCDDGARANTNFSPLDTD
jgi:hypothetical protein